jgi:hypothetical protein
MQAAWYCLVPVVHSVEGVWLRLLCTGYLSCSALSCGQMFVRWWIVSYMLASGGLGGGARADWAGGLCIVIHFQHGVF